MLTIITPDDFSYRSTLESHGWLSLAPFSHADGVLSRVHRLDDGTLLRLHIREGLEVDVEGVETLTEAQIAAIVRDVRMMFSIDWDLRAFYTEIEMLPGYRWVIEQRAGRLLVCPTVWEDLAKTLMTTNTTWSQTKNMVARLCILGDEFSPGLHAFPTPQQIVQLPVEMFAESVRAGYRAAYLHDLATRISSGELDVERWRELSSDELYKAVRGLRGFGDYAAGTMLRLLGHFDRLAIDTECRAAYKRVTGSETAADAEIRTHYEPFGAWRGLVMWMDIMSG